MCGIVGVMTTELNSSTNNPVNRFFGQALFADTLRGDDSTGIFLLDQRQEMEKPEVFKRALAAPDFLQLKRTGNLLRESNDWRIMIGHNRAATKGAVANHTAHPFQVGNITMVHNGTVYNHRGLPKGNTFDVDSEAICHSIDEQGIEDTVSHLDGAFTLVYHDAVDDSMNFVRNDERPLAFGKVKGKNTVLLSSEANMLQWLAIRNGFSLESVVIPKAGELFKFWVHKDWKEWAVNPTVEKLKLRPKTVYNDNYGNGYNGGYSNNYGKKGTPGTNMTTQPTGTGNTGGTSNVTRFPKGETELLTKLGLEASEDYEITNLRYFPYPGNNGNPSLFGRVEGTIVGVFEDHSAVINGVPKSEWDIIGDSNVLGTIDRIWKGLQDKEIKVSFRKDTYVIVDDLPVVDVPGDGDDDEGGPSTEETFLGPNKVLYTLQEWNRLTEKGCAVCTGNVFAEDHEKTGWTHDNQPVCKECVAANDWTNCLN